MIQISARFAKFAFVAKFHASNGGYWTSHYPGGSTRGVYTAFLTTGYEILGMNNFWPFRNATRHSVVIRTHYKPCSDKNIPAVGKVLLP